MNTPIKDYTPHTDEYKKKSVKERSENAFWNLRALTQSRMNTLKLTHLNEIECTSSHRRQVLSAISYLCKKSGIKTNDTEVATFLLHEYILHYEMLRDMVMK